MYAPANVDFTNDIIAVLNKPGRSTAACNPKDRGESIPDASKSHQTVV